MTNQESVFTCREGVSLHAPLTVWNLLTIEWVEVQLDHLGYPHFFTYIIGAW
jgi:hypothetical protein